MGAAYKCKYCGGSFEDLHDCLSTIRTNSSYAFKCGISGCTNDSVSGSSFCEKHQPNMSMPEGLVDKECVDVGSDMVNHPPHYNTGKFEVIDVLEDTLGEEGFEKYCVGNTLKYLMRYEHKSNPLQDLEKAAWYLNKAIEKRRG